MYYIILVWKPCLHFFNVHNLWFLSTFFAYAVFLPGRSFLTLLICGSLSNPFWFNSDTGSFWSPSRCLKKGWVFLTALCGHSSLILSQITTAVYISVSLALLWVLKWPILCFSPLYLSALTQSVSWSGRALNMGWGFSSLEKSLKSIKFPFFWEQSSWSYFWQRNIIF